MFEYADLRLQLATYLSEDQIAQISAAYHMAAEAHTGQVRYTGEPYVTHPLEVARILATLHLDYESIIAAMLHDVIEDTSVTKVEIAQRFGDKVADLVDGVSKLEQIQFTSHEQIQAENFRKMVLAMAVDIRVILIKLADRLHNMRTLGSLPKEKVRRIALETLDIYAPIAARLGMNSLRVELEDLGFLALYPMRYRVLKASVQKSRGHRREIIHTIEETFKTCLAQAGLQDYAAWGREKHLYSLYKKMRAKGLSLIEVMDVYAFRLIVDTMDACYRALGLIHALYKPVPGRFKDYIAIPKANGYQSLHTVLLGPYGVPIEVQIRTAQMDRMAENGIASHWLYKSPGDVENWEAPLRAREWLKGILEIQRTAGSSLEFIENVKIDLYPDDVYVFTPKGRILALPKGATPVDFAYQVHTDIGKTCVAAKIDRRLAPLTTRLLNGQTIDIITMADASPNPAWLNFVVTGKARTNIRHFLKKQQQVQSEALGERLLEKALQSYQRSLADIAPLRIQSTLSDLKLENLLALYEAIGLGNQMASLVAQRLVAQMPALPLKRGQPLAIRGTEGMAVTYAKCCYPIPGDAIIGALNIGRGIVVHREDCSEAQTYFSIPEKCIHIQWADIIEGEFQVELRIDISNTRGALASIATVIAEASSNIAGVHLEERDAHHSAVHFVIMVKDRKHLARIIRRLRNSDVVIRMSRDR